MSLPVVEEERKARERGEGEGFVKRRRRREEGGREGVGIIAARCLVAKGGGRKEDESCGWKGGRSHTCSLGVVSLIRPSKSSQPSSDAEEIEIRCISVCT